MSKRFGKKYKGKETLKNRITEIKKILDDKKAEDIEVIELKGQEYIADTVVIATTLNSKHGYSLLTYLKEGLKPLGEEFVRVEENDDWKIELAHFLKQFPDYVLPEELESE